jgi:hypothetical protein
MCDRPFKVFRYQVREGTKFCSRFSAGQRNAHLRERWLTGG